MKKIIISLLLTTLILLGTNADTDTGKIVKEQLTDHVYKLVGTGQVKCYDSNGLEITAPAVGEDYFGQDAQRKAPDFNFTENGDGTVTDSNTGLMWQKTPDKEFYSWQEAVDYCNELELGGFSDWRIPSCKELFSLSDFSVGWPYIDTSYFNLTGADVSKQEQYWTSNFYNVGTTHGGARSAFGVNHGTGHIKAYPAETPKGMPSGQPKGPPTGSPKNSSDDHGINMKDRPSSPPSFGKHVRAVRGNVYGVNDFKDNNNGTVTDKSTGLTWTQYDLKTAVDWKTALNYADTLTFAGYSDWRLPDVKELQSIVDYSGVFPAIDPLFNCTPIKNESGDDDYGYYWTSTSARFNRDGDYNYAWYVAFGRAVGPDGKDTHGAGAVRFDTKVEGGSAGESAERIYNFVRLVRNAE